MKTIYLLGALIMAGISAQAQIYLPLKDFQDQSITSGGWQSFVVTSTPGSYDWATQDLGSAGNFYAIATGWNGSSADDTELWMVTASFDLTSGVSPELEFRNAENFGGPVLEVLISINYDGSSDPSTQGTWLPLSPTLSGGGFAWTNGGPVDLSAYNGNASVYIAFKYTSSTTAGASSWEIDDVIVSEPIAPTTVSVYDIQNAAGDSPYMNQIVSTGGIVTGKNSDGYAIQAGTGANSGVWVRDSVNTLTVSRGDSILITGTVDEFFNFTQVEMITSFSIESSGNNEPAATVVTTSGANAEGWEGTKIQVENAPCTLDNDGFGQWILNDASGNVLIDNELYVYPSPTISNVYTVTGIGWYAFSEFKIQPRDINDIEDITGVEEFDAQLSLYPNPVNNVLNISSDKMFDLVQVYNGIGQLVISQNTNGSSSVALDMSELTSGVYQVSIQNGNSRKVERIVK